MKIAAVQMVSTLDVQQNLLAARRRIAEAAAAGAQLVALPEYFCFIGRRDADKLSLAEPAGEGPIQRAMADTAREHRVWVVAGTMPIRMPGAAGKVRNTNFVYAPDGSQAARYDKVHLFAYDNGREHYDEARTLEPGSEPVSFMVTAAGGAHRVGLSVCYDLRFPELYRALAFVPGQPPCDLMCVPAAFTTTTGQAHWELLLRARAVENQCYVIAPAQGGVHESGRRTWGHSMIIDPWGTVLAQLDEGEGLVMAEIDSARLAEVRLQLPALQHRRI